RIGASAPISSNYSNIDANDTVDRGCEVCRRARSEQWAVTLSKRRDGSIVVAERGGDSMVEVPYGSEDLAEVAEDADGDEGAEGNGVSDAAEVAEGVEVAENAEDAEVVQGIV
ncbi:hypothetical protein PV326_002113, partial [Microctonus aethiopoides]